MPKIIPPLFCIPLLILSCRGVKTTPTNYAGYQKKQRPQMIAVFMDGTRDMPHAKKPWKDSHVKRVHNLAYDNIKTLYIEGVGAGNRFKQAAYAITTDKRVMAAYRFLTENYHPGDSICLFGFSRGANQCRILSGFIYTIGFINLAIVQAEPDKTQLLLSLYQQYASTAAPAKKQAMDSVLRHWAAGHPGQEITVAIPANEIMIELMGLWDTVEAFEVKDTLETTTPLPPHLNQLCNVKKLYHALSLDDNRAFTYTPILATHKEVLLQPGQHIDSIVEEVWFNGCHKDVGGGVVKKERDQLSGIALQWMLKKAAPYHIFRDTAIHPNIYGAANNMRAKRVYQLLSPGDTLRAIDKYWAQMNPACNNRRIKVHASVIARLDSGMVQDFKTGYKYGQLKRADWYDWAPFNKCFERVMISGVERIRFKEDCDCVEVVSE